MALVPCLVIGAGPPEGILFFQTSAKWNDWPVKILESNAGVILGRVVGGQPWGLT